jgi:hypothetical protein
MDTTLLSPSTPPKQRANPYILPIIFFVLAIIALILLTVLLYYYSQNHQCRLNPNIWCWDDFQCDGSTATPSSIYGPTSAIADVCYTPDGVTGTTGDTVPPPGCTCAWGSASALAPGCTGVTFDPNSTYQSKIPQ